MYSFSTCWNSHRHIDGRAMLREIRGLGFEFAELSHGIRLSLLPGIFEAVDAGEIRISTLHNFCPLPVGVTRPAPNLYKFSSGDRRERENAFRHSVRTIETAARLGAPVVVLHMGCVEMDEFTDRLAELAGEGLKDSPKYAKLRAELLEKRAKRKDGAAGLATEMLGRLVEVAATHGVRLGIENREALEEIPFEEDFIGLLEAFPAGTVGYWHDTGHAQIKENLGFLQHGEHLRSLAGRLLGLHIHDVEFPANDHCAPGTGTVDFAALAPVVRQEHIKVFEISPGVPEGEMMAGVARVRELWGAE